MNAVFDDRYGYGTEEYPWRLITLLGRRDSAIVRIV